MKPYNMNLRFGLPIYIIAVLIMVICIVNAGQHYYQKSERGQGYAAKSTTLAPQIQEILSQLKDSKLLRDKANYKVLLAQMKEIYHTATSPPERPKCNKCRG